MRTRVPPAVALVLASSLALTLSACGSPDADAPSGAKPKVVAAFYPLQYAATSVGGADVDVSSLTAAGVEPHDLELSAAQVADIADADVVLYIKGFQPAVDDAVAQQAGDRALDVSAGLDLHDGDPHVWLDPANMKAIVKAVEERLSAVDSADASEFAKRTAAVTKSLDELDADYRTQLATCRSHDLVTSHEAFGYLAAAFGLTQVGISGLSPDAEPSPARLKDVADLVRRDGVSTIYYETLVDPKVAQTLAAETGAATAVLDPLEGLAEGSTQDYLSVMRDNLATLMKGQDCT